MATNTKMVDTEKIIEFVERVSPYISQWTSGITDLQKDDISGRKRRQYFNFSIIILIILSVSILVYFGCIEGSAATGILGAIAGYIFGTK